MAACLCAPTTHEGSFRCRFHRGLPALAVAPHALHPGSASHAQKSGAASPASPSSSGGGGNKLSVDRPCLSSVRASPSSNAVALHQVSRDLRMPPPSSSLSSLPPSPSPSPPITPASTSPSSSPSSSASLPPLPSSSPSSRYARRTPTPRAVASSSSTPPCRSPYPGSSPPLPSSPPSSASVSASANTAARDLMSASPRHAAALAIMKRHLHSRHGRSFNGTMPRSSTMRKIGPSRFSRMARACAEEVPVVKKVDSITPNLPSGTPLSPNSRYFNSDAVVQTKQSQTMEATEINLKMHSIIMKFKQSELSCKVVGCKAGTSVVPTVY